jgi:hypothetical protein
MSDAEFIAGRGTTVVSMRFAAASKQHRPRDAMKPRVAVACKREPC